MARKKSRFQVSEAEKDGRRRRLILLFGLAGAIVGGVIGYPFGYFIVPLIDTQRQFFTTPNAAAALFVWLLPMVGILVGIRWAEGIYQARRRREQQQSRRERYKAQIERYEQEQAALAAQKDGYDGDRMASSRKQAKARGYESPWP